MEYHLSRDTEDENLEVTLTIAYRIVGRYVSGTHEHPPEYPEIDIISAVGEDGIDYINELTTEEFTKIEQKIQETDDEYYR